MVDRAIEGTPLRIKAQHWNDVAEAANIFQRHHRSRDAAQKKEWIIPTDWALVRNDSGSARRMGDCLQCGDYLLDEPDPFSLWFSGVVPTEPPKKKTHGVLRAAMSATQTTLERLQVSGICQAWVNVTDTNHRFCDAEPDTFVLKSNNVGPHKIVSPTDATGEQALVVLLYAADSEEILAEAYAATDHCPDDPSGTGTGTGSGSQSPEVEVYDFRLQPSCTLISPPPMVTNPRMHRWPAGTLLFLAKRRCPESAEDEWRVVDVELRRNCYLVGIDDRESCLVSAALHVGSEWCPADEPMEACVVVTYTDCDTTLPPCDTDWIYDKDSCCGGGTPGTGTGSGTS